MLDGGQIPGSARFARAVRRPAPMSAAAKARLAWEVVRGYVRARRAMSGNDLRGTLAELRRDAVPPEALDVPLATEATRLGRAVRRTLRLLPLETRCLLQSLTLTSLLADRGIGTTLVIGVRPGETGESFGAHAWVELDGRPLLPTGSGFERLVDL